MISAELVAIVADRGIAIFIGIASIVLGLAQKTKKGRLLLVLGVVTILFQIPIIISEINHQSSLKSNLESPKQSHIKISKDLKHTAENGMTLLTANQTITSKDGYSIMLPKGYEYGEPQTKVMSLLAFNRTTFGNVAISTHTLSAKTAMPSFIKQVQNSMSSRNKTYVFSKTTEKQINGYRVHLFVFEVTKPKGVVKGISYFFTEDTQFCGITVSAVETVYAQNEPDFEKIINSFSFQ